MSSNQPRKMFKKNMNNLTPFLKMKTKLDYDEYDENTYDMNAVSPYMRDAFGEFDEEFEEDV